MPLDQEQMNRNLITKVPVRVSAELGRWTADLQRAVDMQPGEVIDLDTTPDAPVKLFVDGMHYANGVLTVVDGNWAVTLQEIIAPQEAMPAETQDQEEAVDPEPQTADESSEIQDGSVEASPEDPA